MHVPLGVRDFDPYTIAVHIAVIVPRSLGTPPRLRARDAPLSADTQVIAGREMDDDRDAIWKLPPRH
jgi:hypothetical protein